MLYYGNCDFVHIVYLNQTGGNGCWTLSIDQRRSSFRGNSIELHANGDDTVEASVKCTWKCFKQNFRSIVGAHTTLIKLKHKIPRAKNCAPFSSLLYSYCIALNFGICKRFFASMELINFWLQNFLLTRNTTIASLWIWVLKVLSIEYCIGGWLPKFVWKNEQHSRFLSMWLRWFSLA